MEIKLDDLIGAFEAVQQVRKKYNRRAFWRGFFWFLYMGEDHNAFFESQVKIQVEEMNAAFKERVGVNLFVALGCINYLLNETRGNISEIS